MTGEERRAMGVGGWRVAVVMAMIFPGTVGGTRAQEPTRSPAQIRECLCQEQSVTALSAEVQNQSRRYEDKRQAFQQLDQQVQASRPRVDVSNAADVDAFKRLLERRDAAADTLAGDVTRGYADVVTRYNQAVVTYNGACAGNAYDPIQIAELRRGLSCPKP